MMNFDSYKNDLPYPSHKEREARVESALVALRDVPLTRAEYVSRSDAAMAEARQWYNDQVSAYREREAELNRKFRADMECDLDLIYLPDNVRNDIWKIVWSWGHSQGYSDIYNVALDVAPVVVAAYQAGVQAGILRMTPE